MNKKIVALILMLFLFPIVSAIEITTKQEINQGETFLAKVSGNFFEPLNKNKIIFKRDHVRVPMISIIERIEGDFYIYTQTYGKEPGNYSITLEETKSYKVNEIVEEDLVANFVITESQGDFFIEPYIFETDKDFEIEIQNLRNTILTIDSRFYEKPLVVEESNESGEDIGFFESLFGSSPKEEIVSSYDSLGTIILKSGEKKKIKFQISNFPKGFNELEIFSENSNYVIPVFSLFEKKEEIKGEGIDFDQGLLNLTLIINNNNSRIVYLFNNGNESIDEITLSLSDPIKPYVNLSKEKIYNLKENSNESIEIFFSAGSEEKLIEGEILADSKNFSTSIQISLNSVKSFTPIQGESKIASCSELGGNLCSQGQKCRGDLESANDGNCCIGVCEKESSRSYAGIIVGWILIIAVLGYAAWFYLKKYKGVRKITDLLKIARGSK